MVQSFSQYLLRQYPGGYGPAPVPAPLTPEEELALQQEAYYSGGQANPTPPPPTVYDSASPSPQAQYDQQYVAAEQGYAPQGQPVPAVPPSEYYDRGMGGDPQPMPQPYQSPSPQINYGQNQYAAPPSEYYDRGMGTVQNAPVQTGPPPSVDIRDLSPSEQGVMTGREQLNMERRAGDVQQEYFDPEAIGQRKLKAEQAWNRVANNVPLLGEGTLGRQVPSTAEQQPLDRYESAYGSLPAAYEQVIAAPARQRQQENEQTRRDAQTRIDAESAPRPSLPSIAPDQFAPIQDAAPPRFANERYEATFGERDRVATQFFGKPYVSLDEQQRSIVDDSLGGSMLQVPDLSGVGNAISSLAPDDTRSTQARVEQSLAARKKLAEYNADYQNSYTTDAYALNPGQWNSAFQIQPDFTPGGGLRMTASGLLEVPVSLPGLTISPENFSLFKIATDEANRQLNGGLPIYSLDGNNILSRGIASFGAGQSRLLGDQFTEWLNTDEGKAALRNRFSGANADPNGLVQDWTESMGFWESMWNLSLSDPTIGLEAIGGALGIGGRALEQIGVRAAARGVNGAVRLQQAGRLIERVGRGTENVADPVFNAALPAMGRIMPGFGPSKSAQALNQERTARETAESFLNSIGNPAAPGGVLPASAAGGSPPPNAPSPASPAGPNPGSSAPQTGFTPAGGGGGITPGGITPAGGSGGTTPNAPWQRRNIPASQPGMPAPSTTTNESAVPAAQQPQPQPASGPKVRPSLPDMDTNDFQWQFVRNGVIGTTFATPDDVPVGRLTGTASGRERYRVGNLYRVDEGSDGRWYITGNIRPGDAGLSVEPNIFGGVAFGFDLDKETALDNAQWLFWNRQQDPNGRAWTQPSVDLQWDELRSRRGLPPRNRASGSGPGPQPGPNPSSGGGSTPPQAGPNSPGGGRTSAPQQPQPNAPTPSAASGPTPQTSSTMPSDPSGVEFDPIPGGVTQSSEVGRMLTDMARMSDDEYDSATAKGQRATWYRNGFLRETPGSTYAQRAAHDRYLWLTNERAKRGLTTSASRRRAARDAAAAADPNAFVASPNTTDRLDMSEPVTDELDDLIVEAMYTRDGNLRSQNNFMVPESAHSIIKFWITHPLGGLKNSRQLDMVIRFGKVDPKDEAMLRMLVDQKRGSGNGFGLVNFSSIRKLVDEQRIARWGEPNNETMIRELATEQYYLENPERRTPAESSAGVNQVNPTGAERVGPQDRPGVRLATPEELQAAGMRPDIETTVVDVNGTPYYVRMEANGKYRPFESQNGFATHMPLNDGADYDTLDEAIRGIQEANAAGMNQAGIGTGTAARDAAASGEPADPAPADPVSAPAPEAAPWDRPLLLHSGPGNLTPLDVVYRASRGPRQAAYDKLSDYTPTVYRETSLESLTMDFLPISDSTRDMSLDDVFFANAPTLALGQGRNVGVLAEFDASLINGKLNRNKPGWEAAYASGDAEFIARFNEQADYRAALKSFTIKADAQVDRVTRAKWRNHVERQMSEAGWSKTTNPDGSVTWTRPDVAPSAASAAPAAADEAATAAPALAPEAAAPALGLAPNRKAQFSEEIREITDALRRLDEVIATSPSFDSNILSERQYDFRGSVANLYFEITEADLPQSEVDAIFDATNELLDRASRRVEAAQQENLEWIRAGTPPIDEWRRTTAASAPEPAAPVDPVAPAAPADSAPAPAIDEQSAALDTIVEAFVNGTPRQRMQAIDDFERRFGRKPTDAELSARMDERYPTAAEPVAAEPAPAPTRPNPANSVWERLDAQDAELEREAAIARNLYAWNANSPETVIRDGKGSFTARYARDASFETRDRLGIRPDDPFTHPTHYQVNGEWQQSISLGELQIAGKSTNPNDRVFSIYATGEKGRRVKFIDSPEAILPTSRKYREGFTTSVPENMTYREAMDFLAVAHPNPNVRAAIRSNLDARDAGFTGPSVDEALRHPNDPLRSGGTPSGGGSTAIAPAPEPAAPAPAPAAAPEAAAPARDRYVVSRQDIERTMTVQQDGDRWGVYDVRQDGTVYLRERFQTEAKAKKAVDDEVKYLTKLADRFNALDDADKRFLLTDAHPFWDRNDHWQDAGRSGVTGMAPDGELSYGYIEPVGEDALRSDLTGMKIRWYLTLPSSKKIAHPDEVKRIRMLDRRLRLYRGEGLADPASNVEFNPERPFGTRTIVSNNLPVDATSDSLDQIAEIGGVRGKLTGNYERGEYQFDANDVTVNGTRQNSWSIFIQYMDEGRRNSGYRIQWVKDFGGTRTERVRTNFKTVDEAFVAGLNLLTRNGELPIPEKWRGSNVPTAPSPDLASTPEPAASAASAPEAAAPAATGDPTPSAINRQTVTLDDLTLDEDRFQPGDGTTKRRVRDSDMYRNMIANWSEAEFQRSPTVQVWRDPADGRLYVIGGQHRITAMKDLFPGSRQLDVEIRNDLLTEADAKNAARVDNNKGRAETTMQKAEGMNDIIANELARRGLDERTMTAEQFDEVLAAIPYGDENKARLAAIGRLPIMARTLLNASDRQLSTSVQQAAAKFGELIGPESGMARGQRVISRGDAEALWTALKNEIEKSVASGKRKSPRVTEADINSMIDSVKTLYLNTPQAGQGALFDTSSMLGGIDGDVAARIIASRKELADATKKAEGAKREAIKKERELTNVIRSIFPDRPEMTPQRVVTMDVNNDPALDDTLRRLARAFRQAGDDRIKADEELADIVRRVQTGKAAPSTGPAQGQNALFFRSPTARNQANTLQRQVTQIRSALGQPASFPQTAPDEVYAPVAAPGTWSSKHPGAILTKEEERLLDTKIVTDSTTGRREAIGDVAPRYAATLKRAQAIARKPAKTNKELKELKATVAKFNLDAHAQTNGMEDGMALLANPDVTNAMINRIAAERIGTDMGITVGARDARGSFKETDLFGRIREPFTFSRGIPVIGGKSPLRGIDAYLNFRRATALYSPYRGPAYILTQLLGNAISLGVARPSALNDYGNVLEWGKIYQRMTNLSVESRVDRIRKDAGLPHTNVLYGANARDELGSTQVGLNKMANIATFGLGSKVRKAANTFDVAIREALWHDVWMREIGKDSLALMDHAETLFKRADARLRQTGATPFTIDPQAIRNTIDGLRGQSGNATFGARDVKAALEQLYDDAAATGTPLPPRSAWSNYADRVARDWKENLSSLDKRAKQEVNRVAFSFEETVADSAIRRVFMFHYWTTRAASLYVQEGIRNPALATAYFRLFDAMKEENEQNRGPKWMTGFIDFMKTPAGYTAFWDPTSLLQTAMTFQDFEADNKTGISALGNAANFAGRFAMPNPLLLELLTAAGMMGPSYKTPDVIGADVGWSRTFENIINSFNQRNNPNAAYKTLPDSRDALNWLNRITTGKLAEMGAPVEQADYWNSDNFKRTQFESMLIDVLSEENPRNGADFREWLRNVAPSVDPMSDDGLGYYGTFLEDIRNDYEPGDPQYQEAFARFNQMMNAGQLSGLIPGPVGDALAAVERQWSPFQIISQVNSQADRMADTRQKEEMAKAGNPLPPGEDRYNQTISQLTALTPEGRERRANSDYWGNPPDTLGTANQRKIVGTYNSIKSGNPDGERIVIGGRTYTSDQLKAMDFDQRSQLAIEWMDTTQGPKGWREFDAYQQAKDEWYSENPVPASMAEFEARASEYPGGKEQFVQTVMENNPGFKAYMDEMYARYPENPDEAVARAFSIDAYEALMGVSGNIYEAAGERAENGPRVPNEDGVIEQVDLAAAFGVRRQEEAERRAKGDEFMASLQQDFDTLGAIKQKLNAYDPSGAAWKTYIANTVKPVGEKRSKLPSGVYEIVKGSFTGPDGRSYDYPMQGGYAAGYLAYVLTDPENTMSFEVWQKQESKKRKEAGTPAPEDVAAGTAPGVSDPATLVGRASDPDYFPGQAAGVPFQVAGGDGAGQQGGLPFQVAGQGSAPGRAPTAVPAPVSTPVPAPASVPPTRQGGLPFQVAGSGPAAPTGESVTANVNNLNLRAGPDVNAPVLRLLPQGERMQVIGRDGYWVRVRFTDGSEGWVSSAYLDAA